MIKRPPDVMSGRPLYKIADTHWNTGAIEQEESYSRINLSSAWLSNLPEEQHSTAETAQDRHLYSRAPDDQKATWCDEWLSPS